MSQTPKPEVINTRQLRRTLVIYATVGAFVIGVLAAGLTIAAFTARLAEAVSDVKLSAGRASASAIYEVANGQHKVARQITSRTRARVLLNQLVDGELAVESFAQQTSRILADALSSGDDVAGIVRIASTGERVKVGESYPEQLWPAEWEHVDGVVSHGPLATPEGLRLILAAPIKNADGQRLGTDIITVTLDGVAARLATTKTKAGGTTRIYLLYSGPEQPMLLLADGSVEPLRQRLESSADAVLAAVESRPEHRPIDILARALQVGVSAVGMNDWHVVVTQSSSEVFSGLLRQLLLVTIAVLILGAAGSGGIYLLLRPVTGTLMIHADTLTQEVENRSQALQQANECLMQAEKMASLGNMVAGVAHEINTPVGIILTGASHLDGETAKLKRLYESDNLSMEEMEAFISATEESTQLILSNAHRAADLIHSFKQVAVDRAAGERRLFALREYLDEILLSLRPQLKKRPITVTVQGPAELTLDTYPGALSQVITNLVINSLVHGFTEEQEGRITIGFSRADDMVELNYQDNGKGIPAENRKSVFDPFFTTRRNAGGSGLGLNIVFNLVANTLGGSVVLADSKEPGTTFILRFPLLAPQQKNATS